MADQPPSLFLHDGRLRIERLGWTVSETAELAYLSGCSTAEAALGLTDEAHHLAAALQAAGFPHVVGTLWGAEDSTGVMIAKEFYDKVAQAATVTSRVFADSLHHSLRSVRGKGYFGGMEYMFKHDSEFLDKHPHMGEPRPSQRPPGP